MLGDNLDEEFIPEDEADAGPAAIKRLRERLGKAIEEKQQYLEGWQRSKADFVNLKRDEESRRDLTQVRLKASLAEDLVPVLDSFEMALRHAPDNKELALLNKQLLDAVKKMGVERFGGIGEEFDPHKHEALREITVEKPEQEHTIVSIERSGYSIGDHIIRPAQVSVGHFVTTTKS
ncbi:nucleotide exchange factor GrpE [Acetobacteraceae bacterium]|nr:nucleotide exchange factor GrpE [Candidatus Parcubacteria bacterium]